MFRNAIGAAKDEFASMCIRLLLDFSVSVQNRKDLWYTIKNLLQMKRGVFLDNHKKSVLWVIDIAKLLAIVCGATLLGILFVKVGFPETNIVVIYIFAVLLVARFTKGYFYGILSSVVCLLCFNYFFTSPYHTLAVNYPSYIITFSIMLITALITSALTTKEKLMTMEATRKGM